MALRRRRKVFYVLSQILILTALATLVAGIFISWQQFKSNKTAEQNQKPEVATVRAANAPSTKEPPPDEFEQHTAEQDAPRYIFIPKISVRSIVSPLGLNKDNQIAVPDNIFKVGWYNKSAKPGQPGAVVADGHVSSWEARGVFYRLKELRPDDNITIERGDGRKIIYRVVKSKTYDADKVDMAEALASADPDKPGLNLITCGGQVIKGTNNFDKRIVVFAEQL